MTAQEDYETNYPADVRSMALKVMTAKHLPFMSMYLCEAILAERNRCADIAKLVANTEVGGFLASAHGQEGQRLISETGDWVYTEIMAGPQ